MSFFKEIFAKRGFEQSKHDTTAIDSSKQEAPQAGLKELKPMEITLSMVDAEKARQKVSGRRAPGFFWALRNHSSTEHASEPEESLTEVKENGELSIDLDRIFSEENMTKRKNKSVSPVAEAFYEALPASLTHAQYPSMRNIDFVYGEKSELLLREFLGKVLAHEWSTHQDFHFNMESLIKHKNPDFPKELMGRDIIFTDYCEDRIVDKGFDPTREFINRSMLVKQLGNTFGTNKILWVKTRKRKNESDMFQTFSRLGKREIQWYFGFLIDVKIDRFILLTHQGYKTIFIKSVEQSLITLNNGESRGVLHGGNLLGKRLNLTHLPMAFTGLDKDYLRVTITHTDAIAGRLNTSNIKFARGISDEKKKAIKLNQSIAEFKLEKWFNQYLEEHPKAFKENLVAST